MNPHGRPLLISMLTVTLLGCAAARAPLTCPEQGGPGWIELSSEHFILSTDLGPEKARATAARFEQLHAALAAVMQRPAQTSSTRVEIILFDRKADYDAVASRPGRSSGFFTPELPSDLEPYPVMVMPEEGLAEEAAETFLHELAHRFLHEKYASLPIWLNEGLAQYYQTMLLEGSAISLGNPGPLDFTEQSSFWYSWRGNSTQLQIPSSKAPTVWDLIHTDRDRFYGEPRPGERASDAGERRTVHYGASWKLVHLLMNGPDAAHRDHFAAFLAALQGGARAREAFLEAFGADLPRLEQDFRRYLHQARLSRRHAQLPAVSPSAPASERPMTDADVHLLWARLLFTPGDERAARAHRELDEVLARAPGSAEVHYRRAIFHLREDRLDDADRELDRLQAASPDDARFVLARVTREEKRARDWAPIPPELIDRLTRTATTAAQLHTAGIHTANQRSSEEGLRLVDRAIALDPLCWSCQASRAQILRRLGRMQDALTAADRAIAIWPEGLSMVEFVELRGKIVKELGRQAPAPQPMAAPGR